jgi:hypothetical protein
MRAMLQKRRGAYSQSKYNPAASFDSRQAVLDAMLRAPVHLNEKEEG